MRFAASIMMFIIVVLLAACVPVNPVASNPATTQPSTVAPLPPTPELTDTVIPPTATAEPTLEPTLTQKELALRQLQEKFPGQEIKMAKVDGKEVAWVQTPEDKIQRVYQWENGEVRLVEKPRKKLYDNQKLRFFLNEQGEWEQLPRIVGVLGDAGVNMDKIMSYPIETIESPENPEFPLERDVNGKPILGVIAQSKDIAQLVGGSRMGLIMVGKGVAAIFESRQGFPSLWRIVYDVPVGNHKKEYIRIVQYMPADTNNPDECREKVTPVMGWQFLLSNITSQIDPDNNYSKQPLVTIDLSSALQPTSTMEDWCMGVVNFFANDGKRFVGTQIGLTIHDPTPLINTDPNGEVYFDANLMDYIIFLSEGKTPAGDILYGHLGKGMFWPKSVAEAMSLGSK